MLGNWEPWPGNRKQTPGAASEDRTMRELLASGFFKAAAASPKLGAATARRYAKCLRPICNVQAASARLACGFCSRKEATFSDAWSRAVCERPDNKSTCAGLAGRFVATAGASSRMTCAFVPPTPNALTPARRGEPLESQSASFVLMRNGLFAKSKLELGF